MPTLSDRVSDLLGQAVIAALAALVVGLLALWVDRGSLLARLDGVEQLLTEVRSDFKDFRAGGSRFLPLGVQIQAQIDECKEEMDYSRKQWIQCIRLHENVEGRIHFLEEQSGE